EWFARLATLKTSSVMSSAPCGAAISLASHSDYQPVQNLLRFTEPTGDYARRQAQLGVRYRF
ncbi:MAG TPA: hypothetical protein VHM30_09085, partial [Gemmatimonadaceae bacterium]|nr:hypothetical protein [Gemmatimonadaceae bacterium]